MAVHSHFSKKSEPSKKFHQFSSSNHIRIDRTRTPHSQRAKGVEGRFDRSVLYSAQNMRERGTKRNITGSKHTEKISLMLLPTTKENVMSLFIDRLLSCKSRACQIFRGWLNSELYSSLKFNRSSEFNSVFAQSTELDLAFEFNAVSELNLRTLYRSGSNERLPIWISGLSWG